jgi:Icc protein
MYGQYTDECVPFKADRNAFAGDWIFILLDTTIEGQIDGRLSEPELERLDRDLTTHADKHAMVCMHHNPFSVGPGAFNEFGCLNGDEFFSVIDKHRNVKAILTGHVHQEHDSERNGVRLLSSPSTCIQFLPGAATFTLDLKPPGYRRFTLNPDGKVETSVHRLANIPEGMELSNT